MLWIFKTISDDVNCDHHSVCSMLQTGLRRCVAPCVATCRVMSIFSRMFIRVLTLNCYNFGTAVQLAASAIKPYQTIYTIKPYTWYIRVWLCLGTFSSRFFHLYPVGLCRVSVVRDDRSFRHQQCPVFVQWSMTAKLDQPFAAPISAFYNHDELVALRSTPSLGSATLNRNTVVCMRHSIDDVEAAAPAEGHVIVTLTYRFLM